MTGKSITEFRGEYYFLSNFYQLPSKMEFEGLTYHTSEAAYAAAKSHDPIHKMNCTVLRDAGHVKKEGRRANLREDWEEVKVDIMLEILRIKFSNPVLKQKLIDTGDMFLIEGNWWGDTFWGVCNGRGENMLGKLLMKVRDEINGETL